MRRGLAPFMIVMTMMIAAMTVSASAQQCWYERCRLSQCWTDQSYGRVCQDYCTYRCYGDPALYSELQPAYVAAVPSGGMDAGGAVILVIIIMGIIAWFSTRTSGSDGTAVTPEVVEIESLTDRAETLAHEIDDAIASIMAEARKHDEKNSDG